MGTTNTTFEPAQVVVTDWLPRQLRLGPVTGARKVGWFGLSFRGSLAPAEPPGVAIAPGSSPAGYLPLSAFGIAPVSGVGDETITNYSVPAFVFAGQTYSRIGVVSDGYVVVGGGTAADISPLNQNLPNAAVPNNVLAPFWTDLDPSKGGALRVATLTDGTNTWLVVDWENVRVYTGTDTTTNSFQVWIGLGTVEDISYTYGGVGAGDSNLLTVGAENFLGNRGQSYFYNGTGSAPAPGTELRVTGTAGAAGETHTITYDATAVRPGSWVNCAELSTAAVFGITTSCVPGEVTKP